MLLSRGLFFLDIFFKVEPSYKGESRNKWERTSEGIGKPHRYLTLWANINTCGLKGQFAFQRWRKNKVTTIAALIWRYNKEIIATKSFSELCVQEHRSTDKPPILSARLPSPTFTTVAVLQGVFSYLYYSCCPHPHFSLSGRMGWVRKFHSVV